MKKTLCLLLALSLAVMLFGCGSQPADNSNPSVTTTTHTDAPVTTTVTTPSTTAQPTQPVPDGKVKTGLLSQVKAADFSSVDTLTTGKEGEDIVLYTDGLIQDFVVEVGEWDLDGVKFTPSYTLCKKAEMNPDTLVIIKTMFSDSMPHLRVSCRDKDGAFSRYLFQSGKDGSILFVD